MVLDNLSTSKQICYRGEQLKLLPNVYEPCDDTFLLADAALDMVRTTESVLELGTGCGLVAKVVAHSAHSVIATDINPQAVKNARLNGVEAIKGDLFCNLNLRFDLIVFNPPYLPTDTNEPYDWMTQACDGGDEGREVIMRFLRQVDGFLTYRGRVLIVISSLTGYREVTDRMKAQFEIVKTLAERKVFFETLYVILGAIPRTLPEHE
ncbi:MAG: HemK2/MTQ2 family protein methyltransferase [Halobacteriota archaeon]